MSGGGWSFILGTGRYGVGGGDGLSYYSYTGLVKYEQ